MNSDSRFWDTARLYAFPYNAVHMTDSVDQLLENVETGVNDVESGPVLDNADDPDAKVEFEIRSEPVFNQLADRMYESDKAALREGVTNAVTAVKRALNGSYISPGEGVIEIRYYEEGNGILVLRDNGIGMSWPEIEKVVSQIGSTTARDDGTLAGQFGMGFLALFKLVGLDGYFVMHTNSRLTDNDKFSGIWNPSGFNRDTQGKFDHPFDDDEYGVQFEFPLKDVDISDIEDWLEDLRWSRIPIVYERYQSGGSQRRNDELGGRPLRTELPDDAPYAEYEDDYVHAIASPGIPSDTVLLDVPIRRNASPTVWEDAPFGSNLLVRLKNENGVVVEGPNEGLMTAKPAEYSSMTAERQDNYISTDALASDDIVMPSPSGTRDTLEQRDPFWEWLSTRLAEDYQQRLRELVTRITTFSDILDLTPREFETVKHSILPDLPEEVDDFEASERELPQYDPDAYASAYSELTGQEISRQTAARLNLGKLEVGRVNPDCDDATAASNHETRMLLDVLYSVHGKDRDGDLFMGVTMNHDKCAVVWDDNADNEVITVEETEWYSVLDKQFDARQLKKVTKRRLDDFDISDEVREQFITDTGGGTSSTTPVEQTKVTVHFGRDGRKESTRSSNISVGDLDEVCHDAVETGVIPWAHHPQTIIAFPRADDRNLGDYVMWLSSKTVAAISVTTRQWEYLQTTPNIQHIDDYIDEARQITFPTSRGTHSVESAHTDGDLLIHLLPNETVQLFRDEHVMTAMESVIATQAWTASNYSWTVEAKFNPESEIVYAPMPQDTLAKIRPLLNTDDTYVIANEVDYSYGDPGERLRAPADAMLYATARLDGWRDTPELETLEAALTALRPTLASSDDPSQSTANSDALPLIETLASLHDSKTPPASQRDSQPDSSA